jgi:hypothetical protein
VALWHHALDTAAIEATFFVAWATGVVPASDQARSNCAIGNDRALTWLWRIIICEKQIKDLLFLYGTITLQ